MARLPALALAVFYLIGCSAPQGSKPQPLKAPSASPHPKLSPLAGPPRELLASPAPNAVMASMVELLARSKEFHGRSVFVAGYAHIEFEGSMLCLHREDVEQILMRNCVWLDVPLRREFQALSDRYVTVRGIFNAEEHGHGGMYPGSIERVSGFHPWMSRTELTSAFPETNQERRGRR